MSTTSAVGGASSAWSDMAASRASAMKARMFSKADGDGSGGVDKAELQALFDKVAKKTGTTAADASEQLGKMDSNSDGSLDADELDTGMKSLLPAPSSTVDFAQQRTGGPGGHGGPPPGPPPEDADSDSSTSSSSTGAAATDPLDTNSDGTVSAQERAVGALQDLVKTLTSLLAEQAYGDVAGNPANDPASTSTLNLAA